MVKANEISLEDWENAWNKLIENKNSDSVFNLHSVSAVHGIFLARKAANNLACLFLLIMTFVWTFLNLVILIFNTD